MFYAGFTNSQLGQLVYYVGVADKYEPDVTEKDTSDYSWWPKAATWENSGMNYGYWGALQEAWFVRRRQGVRQGLMSPMTGSQ
jgi:hypothetical protein